MKKLLFLMAISFLLLAISFPVKAQFTDLLDFTSTNGSSPYSDLTFSHNKDTLFGMTETGGTNGAGCIFSILPDGTGYTDLLDFNTTNGVNPYGALTLAGNMLYGMTEAGGAYNMGCVFSIQTNGSGYTDIMDFNGENGGFPYGSLVLSYTGDSLIGMTSGGDNSYGTIFSMNTNGTNFTVLHEFDDTDGAAPYGSLTLAHTTYRLYGMASSGGTSSYGDIFTIHTDGSGFTDLFNFNNENGAAPISSLVASVSGDTLYGFTSQGGTGNGVIFSLVDGDVFTDLYTFNGTDGYSPEGDMTLANGILYGMTPQGGYGGGNVFSIYPDGSNYTNLLNFNSTNGAYPYGSLLFLNNTLYGMTSQGGTDNDGLIFSFNMLAVDSFQVTGVTCADSYLGSATAYPAGGTSPYTYSWSDGGTNQTESGLTVGTYTVTVTDSLGSTATSVTIISGLSIGISTITNVSCFGGFTGSITVNASGGTGSFIYSWIGLPRGYVAATTGGSLGSLIPYKGGSRQDGLPAGTYTITVRDWCGDSVFVLGTVTQPDLMAVSTTSSLSNICAGASTTLTTGTSGGTAPYTYAWSPSTYLSCSDCQSPIATPPHSIIDTLTVTDNNGCTNFTIDTIVVHSLPTAPGITALNADSTKFVVSKPDSMLSYAWMLSDFGTTYTGTGDTAFLPVYPRKGTLFFNATNTVTGCLSIDTIGIFHYIDTSYTPPPNLPYPRWSKRGVYLENACNIIDSADSITVFVNYCRNNHITYVNLDGTSWYGGPCAVFEQDFVGYDSINAIKLENFIDSLKTRGGVQQVGVIVYSDTGAGHVRFLDSNSFSVKTFNVQNFSNSVAYHNLGLPWTKKIDVLSLDEEFWGYNNDLYLFHNWHIPMLKAMYEAAQECPEKNLRVEDYIGEPMNRNNTGFNVNDSIEIMEADSISLYTDRILNSCYTSYPNVLWNRGDFVMAYSHFGSDSNKNMEIWPVFNPANYSDANCAKCWDAQDREDFLGLPMCSEGVGPVRMEQQYFDSLSFCENQTPKIFTSNGSSYTKYPMGADTNFQILGDAWFQYFCLRYHTFDTNTITGGLHYYVTLPHDVQWLHISVPQPFTVKATVHGGRAPYNYIWRDMNNKTILQSSGSDSLLVTWSPAYPIKISVEALDGADSTAIDYMCIYQICSQPNYEEPVHLKPKQGQETFASGAGGIKVYPNPASSKLNIELMSTQHQSCHFELYDMMGQKVKQEELTNKNTVVDISSLPSGVYFYRAMSYQGILEGSGKVIIEK